MSGTPTQGAVTEGEGAGGGGAPVDAGEAARARLLAELPVSERRVEAAGIPTAVLEGGEGPPIVLLHGPGEFALKWLRIIPSLVRERRVVAPDLPAHGASGGADLELDAERMLAWLEALVEETCPAPPVLVGHVLGGALAARFAARHSGRLEALVLVDTLGLARFLPSPRFALRMVHFMARPDERTYDRFMRQCSADFDGLRKSMGDRWDAFETYTLARARSPESAAVGRLMREIGMPRIAEEELARITTPTTLVWGREDRANRLAVAERAARRYGWPLHVVDDCADDPPRDRPGAFLEILDAVLPPARREGGSGNPRKSETAGGAGAAEGAAAPGSAPAPEGAAAPESARTPERARAPEGAGGAANPGAENRSSVAIATLDGRRISLSDAALRSLASALDGDVLRPGDDGWPEAVRIWNGMVRREPALVVRPASAADVSRAVHFARERRLLVSVKGGGHNIAGTGVAPGGLTLDMSRMRGVDVDRESRLAHVGPGCLLGDVDAETQRHGLATVLGFVSETGVAGLTLGGGFGYLARRYGWAADNLVEVEIVTADGNVRVASREREPDLFWAVRGGGGNFGVVTRFTFRLHVVGPRITGGLMLWDAERADEVLACYRELTETAPRELTAAAVIRLAPPAPFVPGEWHGRPVVGVLVCHSGGSDGGGGGSDGDGGDGAASARARVERDLAPLRALGDPVADVVVERPYVEQQSLLDGSEPKGLCYYWKTEFLPELSGGFLEAFREHALRLTSPMSESVLFHIGGALNERAPDDGAVGNRDARYVTGFAAAWPPDAPASGGAEAAGAGGAAHIEWARAGWEAIRPFSTGGNYVNFQLSEDDDRRTADAYGENLARLRRVKADFDPENLFRVNRNIAPAEPEGGSGS